ncbi:MAG: hypothetical protein QOH95_925, partial [Gaiellaceae bacterium]|nr:hypothetical protein [Gaiellaceae bacterium]
MSLFHTSWVRRVAGSRRRTRLTSATLLAVIAGVLTVALTTGPAGSDSSP